MLKHSIDGKVSGKDANLVISHFNSRSTHTGAPFDEGVEFIWEGMQLINEIESEAAYRALSNWIFYNADDNLIQDSFSRHKIMHYRTIYPVSDLFWQKVEVALKMILDKLFIEVPPLEPRYEGMRAEIAILSFERSLLPLDSRIKIVEDYIANTSDIRAEKLRTFILERLHSARAYANTLNRTQGTTSPTSPPSVYEKVTTDDNSTDVPLSNVNHKTQPTNKIATIWVIGIGALIFTSIVFLLMKRSKS